MATEDTTPLSDRIARIIAERPGIENELLTVFVLAMARAHPETREQASEEDEEDARKSIAELTEEERVPLLAGLRAVLATLIVTEPLPHDEDHPHLINGEFQSDKYPTTPRGKVPLSVKDPDAQPLLWEYAGRHKSRDSEFSADLKHALSLAGYRHHGFRSELAILINRYNRESDSNTPDYILAEFLNTTFAAFDYAARRRAEWHGKTERMWEDSDG